MSNQVLGHALLSAAVTPLLPIGRIAATSKWRDRRVGGTPYAPAVATAGAGGDTAGPRGRPLRVLTICTANRCRSPMAAALLARALPVAARDRVEVRSAGFGPPGLPAVPETVKVMAEVGVDLEGHRSRRVDVELLTGADLILTMTVAHAVQVVDVLPAAWSRTFPIADLVRRGGELGGPRTGEHVAAWLGRLGDGRAPADLLMTPHSVDVTDPIGRPPRAHRRTRDLLAGLVEPVAGWLSGADVIRR